MLSVSSARALWTWVVSQLLALAHRTSTLGHPPSLLSVPTSVVGSHIVNSSPYTDSFRYSPVLSSVCAYNSICCGISPLKAVLSAL